MKHWLHVWRVLMAYKKCHSLQFKTRQALAQYQAKQLHTFTKQLCERSPHFAAYQQQPFHDWPLMDKASMMANFDAMNTAQLNLAQVMDLAQAAERNRNFEPRVGQYTVGLSSGTSSLRSAFVVSDAERAQWAGTLLSKMLPNGLFSGERIALFLRANSQLYTAVRSQRIQFEYFDLFVPLAQHAQRLLAFQASIIVAPAQVLRYLANQVLNGEIQLAPKRVISVAEVLSAQDRRMTEQAFGTVHEIYQATEGFLASSCEYGTLHLNEEYIHIEPEWLDEAKTRFVPIITDFTRITQPIVRYRLNDVLRVRSEPCPCGRVTRAIAAIEGRCDDMLQLPSQAGGQMAVFADVINRALAQCLPLDCDYRLTQRGAQEITVSAPLSTGQWDAVRHHLITVLNQLGVNTSVLVWQHEASIQQQPAHQKMRRIVRLV